MGTVRGPFYLLEEVQIAVAGGRYVLHADVLRSLCRSRFTRDDLEAYIAGLDATDYAGAWPALFRPHERDDVYVRWYGGRRVAVRFALDATFGVIISSFK